LPVDCGMQGVRYIFTINRELASSVQQMLTGDSFVCASNLHFRRVNYTEIDTPRCNMNTTKKGIEFHRNVPHGAFVITHMICVIRTGEQPRKCVKTVLNRKTARTYQQLVSDIAQAINCSSAIKIYSISGRQVCQ